jgi:hypothetical protein
VLVGFVGLVGLTSMERAVRMRRRRG